MPELNTRQSNRKGHPVGRARAGLRRAFDRYPAESRFFLFLTGMAAFGLLLQKATLLEGLAYAAFWCAFMVSMLIAFHDDLFRSRD